MSERRHVLRVLRNAALTVGAVVGVLMVAALLVGAALGVRPVVITSGSMEPTIPTGAVALTRSTPAAEVEVGDVVTVRSTTGSRVTHRVVDVVLADGGATLRLQGDANDAPDPTPYPAREVGRVVGDVPLLGYLLVGLRSPAGLLGLGALAALLLVFALRGGTGHGRGGTRRAGGRRAVRTAAAAGTVAMLAVGGPASGAPWTDDVQVSGPGLTAAVIPPTTLTCQSLNLLSLRFSWTAVAGATSYRLFYNDGNNTLDTTDTTATVGSLVNGGSAWVVVRRNFGSTTWSSVSSNTVTYTVLLVAICN